MSLNVTTETVSTGSAGIDELASLDALSLMMDVQRKSIASVADTLPAIDAAATQVARTLKTGGKLVYAGSGSSGLMAMADGLELPGTFGVPKSDIHILLSEGLRSVGDFDAATEDNHEQGEADCQALALKSDDCVIAISASGSTPYAMGIVSVAKTAGATCIAIANNENAPLLLASDIAVFLATPSEIVAGSTRMGAATAQKAALNLISTQAGLKLGHIHDGMMVNVRVDNAKLKQRARRIVMVISDCNAQSADRALTEADGSVKCAVLLAAGVTTLSKAKEFLIGSEGHLRPVLDEINRS